MLHEKTRDNLNSIKTQFSRKYNIPKGNISVVAKIKEIDENGQEIDIQSSLINNIQSPEFQQNLMKEYINLNNIENIDFDKIVEIDNDINEGIDWSGVEKYGEIKIKWIRFSNFLSFGKDNYIDYTKFKGIVGINSVPSNMGGKTSLALELPTFLLYGKSDKCGTLDEVFNKWNKDETEVNITGCVVVDNQEYVIERIITRPFRRTAKSKPSQKVNYYRVVNGLWDENSKLDEYNEDVQNIGEDVRKTTKIIKDAICKESDFRLVTSATRKSLEDIIEQKPTERNKLFKRWIGLNTIESKCDLAKTKWSKDINPKLLSNSYNVVTLQEENATLKNQINESQNQIKILDERIINSNNSIDNFAKERDNVLASKGKVDDNLVKLDFETEERKKSKIVDDGKEFRLKEKDYISKIAELKNAVITIDKAVIETKRIERQDKTFESNKKCAAKSTEINQKIQPLVGEIATIKATIQSLKEQNKTLDGSRVCPTCKREYDSDTLIQIDKNIVENNQKIQSLIQNGVKTDELKKKLEKELNDFLENENNIITKYCNNIDKEIAELVEKLEAETAKVNERDKWELKLAQVKVEIERGLNEYTKVDQLIKNYNANREIIKRNNDLDIQISNINLKIKTEQDVRDSLIKETGTENNNVKVYTQQIENNSKIIDKLYVEAENVKHWKLYLELLGKHGITTILVNKVLPIINSNIDTMLSGLYPYRIEVRMNDNNDVEFVFVEIDENGDELNVSDISSASGLESTIAALCIRSSLCKISSFSKLNFLLLDEIIGSVASEFMGTIKEILDRIVDDYQFIFIISHNDEVKTWCNTNITVEKEEYDFTNVYKGRNKSSRVIIN
jgi:DNA repair exonuclease SbcCD ATPase subunit